MISIATHFNPARVTDYFRQDVSGEAEFLSPGWLGNFARMLNLEGQISRSADSLAILEHLARGCSPSGVPLLPGVMRWRDRLRRSSYDIVVSAPKSISIAALVGENYRIADVHHRAVETAFEEMQLRAGISYRGIKRQTNALVAAHFVHTHSRENDPHLHSHILTFNMTYCPDPALYSIKSLDPKRIFADSVQLDSIYKNDLAFGLRQLGFEVAIVAGSPEIGFVDRSALQLFSKARRKIDHLEKQLFGTRNHPYHRLLANDRFRKRKDGSEHKLDPETLAQRWREEMSPSARAKLLDAVRSNIVTKTRESPLTVDLPEAVRHARVEASKQTLFVSSKVIWKNLWPLIMGELPWVELKNLIADSLLSARGSSSLLNPLSLAQKAALFDRVLEESYLQASSRKSGREEHLTPNRSNNYTNCEPATVQRDGHRPTL
jgi:conjugative relaxase-like TrwC/TraI family protein